MSRNRTHCPAHLSELRALMPEILQILERGREREWYSFVWLEESSQYLSVSAITERTSESLDRGIVLRVYINGRNFEKSTNILEPDSIRSLAKEFRAQLDEKYPKENAAGYKPKSWEQELASGLDDAYLQQLPEPCNPQSIVHFGVPYVEDPSKTTIANLKKLSASLRLDLQNKAAIFMATENNTNMKNDPYEPLVEMMVMARQEIRTNIFVDREKNMSQTLPISLVLASGVSRSGKSCRATSGGLGGMEVTQFSSEDIAEVTEQIFKLTKAEKIEPGRYRVISGPDVTGVIAHEAFGHTQEGDTWMKGRSIAMNLHLQKTKVGNEQASIVNHANLFSMEDKDHGSNGSFFFDHEGALGRKQTILDQGTLSTPMTDLTSSERLQVPRTANGKRESWRRPLMARQTNTYFTPGDKTFDEIIAMVSDGFLAQHAHGGMEDPKGGSLTAGTAYFEEIKDGCLTGKLFLGPSGGHIELSDPVFSMLDNIVAKTKSVNANYIPENKFGGCGKYHKELVSAGCGGPYILWDSVNCG